MKLSFSRKKNILKKIHSLRFLKNIILISLIFFLLVLGFYIIKNSILSSRKLDLKNYEKLFSEYSASATTIFEDEGIVIFDFKKDACSVKSLIYGANVIEKLEYNITFNVAPVRNKKTQEKSKKDEAICLSLGFQKISEAFETKKTKQEFIKLSKNLIKEFKKNDEVVYTFHGKTLIIKSENNALVLSIN